VNDIAAEQFVWEIQQASRALKLQESNKMALSSVSKDKQAPTVEELEAQIAELKREIASLTKGIAAFGSAKVDDYKAGAEKLASDAIAASVRAMEDARDEAVSLERDFERHVRAKPLQSIGIAVGVGFLAALLTRRS